jgi:hypothetical protein
VFARLREVPSDDVEQSYEDLIDRLAGLFERARERIAARMTEAGMPFTIALQQQVLVPNAEGTGWEGRQEVVPLNFLREDRSAWPPQVLAEWLVDARSMAEELGALFEDRVIVNGAFPAGSRFTGVEAGVSDRSDELDMLVRAAVLSPMDAYVKSLDSPAVGDDSLARRIATDVVRIMSTGKLTARRSIALAGIQTASDEVSIPGCRVRVLSGAEMGELADYRGPRSGPIGGLRGLPHFVIATHVMEVDAPTDNPNRVGMLPIPSLYLALLLHGFDLAGTGVMATYIIPEWWFGGMVMRPFNMRSHVEGTRKLERHQLEAASVTATRLDQFRIDAPERPSEVALQRFMLGCGRQDAIEAILDFVIALEALLLPYDRDSRNADMSYRFRVHGAHYLAASPLGVERRSVFGQLRRLYEVRSRIVHGDNYPGPNEAIGFRAEARQLAARGLLRAVSEGFPDPTGFNRLVLGD